MYTKEQLVELLRRLTSEETQRIPIADESPEHVLPSTSTEQADVSPEHVLPSTSTAQVDTDSMDEEIGVEVVLSDEDEAEGPKEKLESSSLVNFLASKGLGNYVDVLQNEHGIMSMEMFAELEKDDINLFCKVIGHRILFRKLLLELVQ